MPNDDLRWALAGLAACVVAVGANHIVLAPMVSLARGHSLREAGVFSFESLSTDFILATLGLAVAAFWQLNPWLIPFAVAPLLLIHRSLSVPQLQEEARVDPKTGLFNARHFAAALSEELQRAERFERPLSLVMRHVVTRRFGLDGEPPQTLEEVGSDLGITRERVRQLESRALRELRSVAPALQLYLRTE